MKYPWFCISCRFSSTSLQGFQPDTTLLQPCCGCRRLKVIFHKDIHILFAAPPNYHILSETTTVVMTANFLLSCFLREHQSSLQLDSPTGSFAPPDLGQGYRQAWRKSSSIQWLMDVEKSTPTFLFVGTSGLGITEKKLWEDFLTINRILFLILISECIQIYFEYH